jgi:hypothetical protein
VAIFWKRKSVAFVAALAVLQHLVADWPVHNGDLALYPHAARHLGLGLWSSWHPAPVGATIGANERSS